MPLLLEDTARTHLDPAWVAELYESTNQPMVQPSGRGAQPAQAAVAAVYEAADQLRVMVVLTLTQSQVNVVYAGDQLLSALEVPMAIEDALLFAESMGFILDSAGWPALDDGARAELAARLGCFRPPQARKAAAQPERKKAQDPLSSVARLFAAFALGACALLAACTGPSAEQRRQAAEINYDLGTNQMTEGNAQGALHYYLQAEKDDPDLPQLQNALGLVYGFSFGRNDEAEAHFKRALELNPDFPEASNNYGAFLIGRGRWLEAAEQFDRALKNPLYRDRAVAECNLGWALYKGGKADQGVQRLRSALQVSPKYCKGWRQLGTIHLERAALDLAGEAFERYTLSCPEAADAWLQQSKVFARVGKADEARDALTKCVEKGREKDPNTSAECVRLLRELGAK
jgi:type IV pilus biogenesis/stability protein PilW